MNPAASDDPSTDWPRLEPLLDAALDLEGAAREIYLTELGNREPRLAARLREMLDAAEGGTGQLDRSPWRPVTEAAPVASAGQRIGPWRLVAPLGRGGMGEVWLAERADGLMERQAAIKLPQLALRRRVLAERFERERNILARLDHPGIATLLEAGFAEDGQPYLALEYVPGETLTDYVNKRELPLAERVRLMLQICDAVAYAHGRLVVHRDLKPPNILVTGAGEVHLLDFGIAKLLDDTDALGHATELTHMGGRMLTPDYAAPEQFTGAPVTVATDVYTIGVLLYELISGKRPCQLVEDPGQALPPRPMPLAIAPRLRTTRLARRRSPADLDTIVLKALRPEPGERYATVAALAEDLRSWLTLRPISARADSSVYRLRLFLKRRRVAALSASAVLATLALTFAGVYLELQHLRGDTREARREIVRLMESADAVRDDAGLRLLIGCRGALALAETGSPEEARARLEALRPAIEAHAQEPAVAEACRRAQERLGSTPR